MMTINFIGNLLHFLILKEIFNYHIYSLLTIKFDNKYLIFTLIISLLSCL